MSSSNVYLGVILVIILVIIAAWWWWGPDSESSSQVFQMYTMLPTTSAPAIVQDIILTVKNILMLSNSLETSMTLPVEYQLGYKFITTTITNAVLMLQSMPQTNAVYIALYRGLSQVSTLMPLAISSMGMLSHQNSLETGGVDIATVNILTKQLQSLASLVDKLGQILGQPPPQQHHRMVPVPSMNPLYPPSNPQTGFGGPVNHDPGPVQPPPCYLSNASINPPCGTRTSANMCYLDPSLPASCSPVPWPNSP